MERALASVNASPMCTLGHVYFVFHICNCVIAQPQLSTLRNTLQKKQKKKKNILANLCVWSSLKCFSQLSSCHEAIDKRPIAAKVTPLSRLMSVLKNFRDFEIFSLCLQQLLFYLLCIDF